MYENNTTVSKLTFCLIVAILIYAPLPLGANRAWAWGILEFLIFLTAILSVLNHRMAVLKQQCLKLKWLLLPLMLTQCVVLLQLAGPTEVQITAGETATFSALIKGLAFSCFVMCLVVEINSVKKLKFIALVVVASGLVQAVYASYLLYSGLEYSPFLHEPITDRATGSFVYHNHLANFLLMSLSVAIGLLIGSLSRNNTQNNIKRVIVESLETLLSAKWLLRMAIVGMVIALILTRSRMANSAFFISLLMVALLALLIMRKPPPMLKWLIISFVVIDMALVGAMFGIDKVKERMDASSLTGETRDDVVTMAMPMLQDNWLLGTGANTFHLVFPQYHTQTMHYLYDHAHNDYLQFAVEYGIPVTLMLAVPVVVGFYRACKALKERRSTTHQGIAFGSMMAMIAGLMHMTVDFPMQAPATALYFLTVICLAWLSAEKLAKK